MFDLDTKTMNGPVIRPQPADNFVVARVDIEPGTVISGENVVARQKAPAGYKRVSEKVRGGAHQSGQTGTRQRVMEGLSVRGRAPVASSPDEHAAVIRAERERYSEMVRATRLRIE